MTGPHPDGCRSPSKGGRCPSTSSLRSFLEETLDLVFPWVCPFCGEAGEGPSGACAACVAALGLSPSWRCLGCGRPVGRRAGRCCAAGNRFLDGLAAAADYDGPAREAVHRFKYDRSATAGRALGVLGAAALSGFLEVPVDLVVPVPLARRRLVDRGFNQSALLARRLGDALGAPVACRLLERTRETPALAGLGPHGRGVAVRGAFRVRHPRRAVGRAVLVVDDVYTTGATLGECARVLKKAGAGPVFGAVTACSPRRLPS